MTLSINFDHQCPKCRIFYIPYRKEIPCPRCGHIKGKDSNFLDQAAESAIYNLETNGNFLPGNWYPDTPGQHMLQLLFQVLENYRTTYQNTAFEKACRKILDEMDWGSQPYLCNHMNEIAVEVYSIIKSRSNRI